VEIVAQGGGTVWAIYSNSNGNSLELRRHRGRERFLWRAEAIGLKRKPCSRPQSASDIGSGGGGQLQQQQQQQPQQPQTQGKLNIQQNEEEETHLATGQHKGLMERLIEWWKKSL
jgi:hypothetical protein